MIVIDGVIFIRKNLATIEGVRDIFTGTFERFGVKNGWAGVEKTVLLKDIKNKNGDIISDHLWFNFTKGFENLQLEKGDIIQFEARVKEYYKGYKGYREGIYKPIEKDYKLSYPSKIKKL